MNEKITLQSLADAFATANGVTKKFADAFFKQFFDIVVEGLEADGTVKVKGFGTFKLVEIAERESVSVSTGERFVIPGYKKVTFTPEEAFNAMLVDVRNVEESEETEETEEVGENVGIVEENVDESVEENVVETVEENVEETVEEDMKETIDELDELEERLSDTPDAPEEVERQNDEFSGIDLLISTPESIEGAKEDLWRAQNTAQTMQAKALQAVNAAREAKKEVLRLEQLIERLERNEEVEVVQPVSDAPVMPEAEPVSESVAEPAVYAVPAKEERAAVTVGALDSGKVVDMPWVEDKKEDTPADDTDMTDEGKSRGWLIALVVVLLCLCLGGGAYWYFLTHDGEKTSVAVEAMEEIEPLPVVAVDSLDSDSLVADSLIADSLVADSLKIDSVEADSVVPKAAVAESVKPVVKSVDKSVVKPIVKSATKPAVKPAERPKTYTMKNGDTLTKLARRFYGDASYAIDIINANNFSDPNNVHIGTVVILP